MGGQRTPLRSNRGRTIIQDAVVSRSPRSQHRRSRRSRWAAVLQPRKGGSGKRDRATL